MPRPTKGPRLYLRKARPDKGQLAIWVIRDGQKEIGTRCGPERAGEAEQALAEYIQSKWSPAAAAAANGVSDPADVLAADVIALYARDKAPRLADPTATKARMEALLEWWPIHAPTLADVRRSTCEAYVAHRITQPVKSFRNAATARRVTDQGARRELEDYSAAIGFWHDEHPLTRRPKVVLPPKAESARDALTRDQAARLLRAAMGWRFTPSTAPGAKAGEGTWKRLSPSARANRAHLRRFLLIGFYTGSRPGVITKLLWNESAAQAWVDLDAGIIYRRGRGERDHKTKRRPLVTIPDRLAAHMARWSRMDAGRAEAMLQAHIDAGGDPKSAPQLATVVHHGGAPIGGKIRTGFAGIVRDAGLDPDVTPHWLRHTCATWLMERDTKPWDAAGFTGMSVKTLEDCYGHHRPSRKAADRKRFA